MLLVTLIVTGYPIQLDLPIEVCSADDLVTHGKNSSF